jgi:hypothetical protein
MSRTDFSTTVEDTLKVKLGNIQFVTKIITDGMSISQKTDGMLEVLGVTDGQGNVVSYNEIKKAVDREASTAYVFDTESNFIDWVNGLYTRPDGVTVSKLKLGDEIWIKEESTPDYWYSDDKVKPVTMSNFSKIEAEQKVTSVNGQTGDVLLTNTDVNAVASNLQRTQDSMVSSMLNHTKNGISYNKAVYREGGILVKSSNMNIDGSDIVLTETEGIETKEKRPTINGEEVAYLSDIQAQLGDINSILDAINGEVI